MKSLYENLKEERYAWANEEEVRLGWIKNIEASLGIRLHAERERNDASYNQVIIEFKSPGLFKGSTKSSAFKEAIDDRLNKYIRRKSILEGIPSEDYIGIAIDGDHICFAFMSDGQIKHRHLLPVDEASVNLVAQACVDSRRRAVTAQNLVEDFGHEAKIGRDMMGALVGQLEKYLTTPGNNKIKLLFEEWRTLFGQVADLSQAQVEQISTQLSFSKKIAPEDTVAAGMFAIHSYNAILMKLLAAEIVAQYELTAFPDFCEHLLGCENAKLLNVLESEVEQGAFFEAARIKGFVEEAVFSWYTRVEVDCEEGKSLCNALRGVFTQLALYRMDDLTSARSHDVLKAFYQALVPETLRKSLGEFYTPDWLVEVACDRVEINQWRGVRVLDPTCGSGSFLLEAIRRKRLEAELTGVTGADVLESILDEVWGFDLNPLAVQATRVNFLIAIADLVAKANIDVELPVLLADAVYSPATIPQNSEELVEYQIGSSQANLNISLPAKLALDRKRLDEVFELMGESVQNEIEYIDVEKNLIDNSLLSEEEGKSWSEPLSSTYEQIFDLHKKNWNGIWFRVVRNFFWSATAGTFDVVLGNPPWVRWSNLPEQYRERIKPTCERYGIFSQTKFHGGNELDISGMITYTVGDKWLKSNGVLVFVITQTHFQSPSSQGFRTFEINDEFNLIPESVDDLKSLKPFTNVANATAVMKLRKVKSDLKPNYPVEYIKWVKADGFTATIPEKSTKQEVLSRVNKKAWEANPVGGLDSPWAVLPPGRFSSMQAIKGRSDWVQGRKGVTADLNSVFMLRVLDENKSTGLVQVETRPEAGRKDIGPARKFWIEPDLLHPLLKGAADFSNFQVHQKEELYFLIPNAGIKKGDYEAAEKRLKSLPRTRKFLAHYKPILENRSTYRTRQKKAPFYSVYSVGEYTFAPYKVVWAEQSSVFRSAVFESASVPLIGNRPFTPDHKVYFADFQNRDLAYYVCGLLNCSLVREFIESHTIQIQVSNIFKHVRLPKYDAINQEHQKLVQLSVQAHQSLNEEKRKIALDKLDQLAVQLLAN